MSKGGQASRSLGVEATVFWAFLSGLIVAFTSLPVRDIFSEFGLIVGGLYIVVSYLCWIEKRQGFIAAWALALFTTAGTFVLDFGSTAQSSPFTFMSQQAYLLIPQFLLIFYSTRAYRELTTKPVRNVER